MSLKAIERLLEQKIGLSVETVGADAVGTVIRRRMAECQAHDETAYLRYLSEHDVEWDELIEAVVVPETWFFRNEESFIFLGRYLKTEWIKQHPGRHIRALSIPCSTGEEPYSIAMTFLEAGLTPEQFEIDAIDISRKALSKAETGIYGPQSFRRHDTLPLRERYFLEEDDGCFRIRTVLRNTVRYTHGNLLDKKILSGVPSYDIVFCRNLLIYLSASARQHVSRTIDRVLAKTGILFVGHAERPLFQAKNFVAVTIPGVFAYYRTGQLDECKICGERRPMQRFERRKTTRISVSQSSSHQTQAKLSVLKSSPVQEEESRQNEIPQPQEQPSAMLIERRKPPDPIIQRLDMARDLADQGNLQEALHLCDAVLTENAAHVQAHFLMGLIYLALKDDAHAENSFNKTIYLDPEHHEALYHLALIMEDQGHEERAKNLRQRIHRIYQRTQKIED